MSGYQPTHPCLICHHAIHVGRLLCTRCAKPEPEREPTTEWRRRRMEARAHQHEEVRDG